MIQCRCPRSPACARLAAFEARYNAVATPFNWKFTHRDLLNLLQRIKAHQNRAEDHQLAA